MQRDNPRPLDRSRRVIAAAVLLAMAAQIVAPPAAAQARAPVTNISDVPLATAGADRAKPNFLMVLDDSGSMNLEYMPGGDPGQPDAVTSRMAGAYSALCNRIYFDPSSRAAYELPPNPDDWEDGPSGRRFKPFSAATTSFTAAPLDGFAAAASASARRVNLASNFEFMGEDWALAFTYEYRAVGGNAFDEARDCRQTFQPASASPRLPPEEVKVYRGATHVASWVRTPIADPAKFARWYSFYRTRLGAMKSATGLAFAAPTVNERLRIGIVTTTPSADGRTATASEPVHESRFLKVADFDGDHKRRWLKRLYGIEALGQTPLRLALSRAGWYFAGRNDGPATGMIPTPADDPVQYACQRNFAMVVTDGYWTEQLGLTHAHDGARVLGASLDSGAGSPPPFNDRARHWKVERNAYFNARFDATAALSNSASGRVVGGAAEARRCTGTQVGNPLAGTVADVGRMNVYACRWIGGARECTVAHVESAIALSSNDVRLTIPAGALEPGAPSVTPADPIPRFAEVWHRGEREESYKLRPKGYARTLSDEPLFKGGTDLLSRAPSEDAPAGTLVSAIARIDYTPGGNDPFGLASGSCGGATACGELMLRALPDGTSYRSMDTMLTAVGMSPSAGSFVSRAPAGDGARLQPRAARDHFVGCARQGLFCEKNQEGGRWNCQAGEDTFHMAVERGGAGVVPLRPGLNGFVGTPTEKWSARSGAGGHVRATAPQSFAAEPLSEEEAAALGVSRSDGSLADVAKYYYETRLRRGIDARGINWDENSVPPAGRPDDPEADNATWPHMTTFAMGLGVSGFLRYTPSYKDRSAPGNDFNEIRLGADADNEPTSGAKVWPPVIRARDAAKIDDLWHAAVNGRGHYFSASNADEIRDQLASALASLNPRTATGAGASASNFQPVGLDRQLFWTTYTTGTWTGDLMQGFIETDRASANFGRLLPRRFSAAELLNARAAATADDRNVLLLQGAQLFDFAWEGNTGRLGAAADGPPAAFPDRAGATLRAWIDPGGSRWRGSFRDNNGRERNAWDLVNWVRGQSAHELGQPEPARERFRRRMQETSGRNILGDIVGSQPVFVRTPSTRYADQTGDYGAFREAMSARPAIVLVASNAGMLHAFQPGDPDVEKTPNDPTRMREAWAVIPSQVVPLLGAHADPGYTVKRRNILEGSPVVGDVYSAATGWRRIAVTGRGAGGAGYFALDITDPLKPAALWEIVGPRAEIDAGRPGVRAIENLGQSVGEPIITKVRATGYPSGRWVVIFASGYNTPDRRGYLFVADALTGELLNTVAVPDVPPSDREVGLAKVAAYVQNAVVNNLTEAVYGGDLNGNVWRFDFAGDLRAASVRQFARLTGGSPDSAQPVTSRPEVGWNGSNVMVFVGTGRYLGDPDIATRARQSFYGLVDTGAGGAPLSRAQLTERAFARAEGTSSVKDLPKTPDGGADAVGKGWVIDLPLEGERAVADPVLQLGTIVFVSALPSPDPCKHGGRSFLNYLDYRTGGFVRDKTGATTARVEVAGGMAAAISVARVNVDEMSGIALGPPGMPSPYDVPPNLGQVRGQRVTWREVVQP